MVFFFPLLSVNAMTNIPSSDTDLERKVGVSIEEGGKKKKFHKSRDSVSNGGAAMVCGGTHSDFQGTISYTMIGSI